MNTTPRLLTDQSDRVLTVAFNNPPRHFFDERMSIELDHLTRELRRDSTIRAVVFTGCDDTYLTHFDVPSLLRGAETVPVSVGYGCVVPVCETPCSWPAPTRPWNDFPGWTRW